MTQSHSAPAQAGTEHRVKPTALALHVASAASWGRPWRRRALSLPAPRALTFQGIRLPLQPLRSWLHLLSRAGMLGVRPPAPAANVLRRPDDEDDDAPARIDDLGFELSTEMILDFAHFARQSRLNDAAGQASAEPGVEAPGDAEPSAPASSAGIDELHALGMADSVPLDSVDQDFLNAGASVPQDAPDAAPAPQEEVAELHATLEQPVAVDELELEPAEVSQDVPARQEEILSESFAQDIQVRTDVAGVATPEADHPAEPPSLEVAQIVPAIPLNEWQVPSAPVVEPPQQEVIHQEVQEMEVPVVTTEIEPEAEIPEVAAESDAVSETLPEPPREDVPEAPKVAAPTLVVSGVRIARKPVLRSRPPVVPEPAAPSGDIAEPVVVSEPMVEVLNEQDLPQVMVASDVSDMAAPETFAASEASSTTEALAQPQPEVAVAEPGAEGAAAVLYWEPAQSSRLLDMACADAEAFPAIEEAAEPDEFGFEPMIASLEDALAVLAAASVVHDEPAIAAASRMTQSDTATRAAEDRQADDSNLEAVLQGIFIQKETEMTDMRDESIVDDARSTAPVTSVELQEVAATLSVPQLEADPDDVLTDVQSTLNSLAGMAQGLTQQKQAAGRLQEELEEWNAQLQERERQASDKEERLLQLENHLKEAKTNLDRMAAENNRLLAERSEALRELAQTVDLRDKTTVKRAESLQLEQQRIDEQAASLRQRASELDERESSLKRKSEELGVRLKQLQSAKDKFSAIVKSFNETVQFNSTLSAISKAVNE
ncbi:hypothetical protein [Pseudomonas sp. Pseusp97]|uniref:hypothetical protein n=1 Tax=Pseudomonas sp. Pseusp97 TaxID=3243065 RepID=UPI0039A460C1